MNLCEYYRKSESRLFLETETANVCVQKAEKSKIKQKIRRLLCYSQLQGFLLSLLMCRFGFLTARRKEAVLSP